MGGGTGGPNYWDRHANYSDFADSYTKQQSIDLGRHVTVTQIAAAAKACFRKWHAKLQDGNFAITSLGLSLTNMVSIVGRVSITQYFTNAKPAAIINVAQPS